MAPRFGLDDVSTSNFDATLVLATMLASQQGATEMHIQDENGMGSEAQQQRFRTNVSEHSSDHTRMWSDLTGNRLPMF